VSAPAQERTPIPGLCWIPRPGDVIRCTEREGHGVSGGTVDGPEEHFHCYSRTSWPRYEGEQQ
jgi:hypothetical protein